MAHYVNLYLPPADKGTANYYQRLVRWVVAEMILKKEPKAKIIIAGDLNEVGKELFNFLETLGLVRVIDVKEATHV